MASAAVVLVPAGRKKNDGVLTGPCQVRGVVSALRICVFQHFDAGASTVGSGHLHFCSGRITPPSAPCDRRLGCCGPCGRHRLLYGGVAEAAMTVL